MSKICMKEISNELESGPAAHKLESGPAANPILSTDIDGFRLQWKNDGTDYPAIWSAFRQGQLKGQALSRGRPYREVDLVEVQGRRYIIKRDWHVEKRLEKRFWYLILGGTRYTRIFRLINKAVRRGCRVVQDVYLVAERMKGRTTCLEAYLIADYMEGHPMSVQEVAERLDDLCQTVLHIHDCGLACNDIQPYNFVLTTDGIIKAIDMDISSFLAICQINDIRTMKYRFDVDLPVRGIQRRLAWGVLRARDLMRYCWAKVRHKPFRVKK